MWSWNLEQKRSSLYLVYGTIQQAYMKFQTLLTPVSTCVWLFDRTRSIFDVKYWAKWTFQICVICNNMLTVPRFWTKKSMIRVPCSSVRLRRIWCGIFIHYSGVREPILEIYFDEFPAIVYSNPLNIAATRSKSLQLGSIGGLGFKRNDQWSFPFEPSLLTIFLYITNGRHSRIYYHIESRITPPCVPKLFS